MKVNFLQLIENEFLSQKVLAESNIEYILLDTTTKPELKKEQIMLEVEKLKSASLNLTFWNDYLSKNVIIPGEENNNTNKNV